MFQWLRRRFTKKRALPPQKETKFEPWTDPEVDWVADWTPEEASALLLNRAVLSGQGESVLICGHLNAHLIWDGSGDCELDGGEAYYWVRDQDGLRETTQKNYDAYWKSPDFDDLIYGFADVRFSLGDDLIHAYIWSADSSGLSGWGGGYLIQRQGSSIELIGSNWAGFMMS